MDFRQPRRVRRTVRIRLLAKNRIDSPARVQRLQPRVRRRQAVRHRQLLPRDGQRHPEQVMLRAVFLNRGFEFLLRLSLG
jgi:hypothetical protein